MNNLYFSNSAYGGLTLEECLAAIELAGINQVELSVGTFTDENTPALLRSYIDKGFKMIPHHNSPINGKSNFVNLCDRVPTEYFEQVFKFCNQAGSSSYSIHGGHYSPEKINATKAYEVFSENYAVASKLAEKFGVLLSLETAYPTINGNKYVVESEDGIKQFAKDFPESGLVLDFAHVKIQMQSGYAKKSVIDFLLESKMLTEVHISENDGRTDRHTPVLKNSYFWSIVRQRTDVPVVIEGKLNKLGYEALRDNYKMAEELIYG
jgi:sugar phosphate isomerase/epimerase